MQRIIAHDFLHTVRQVQPNTATVIVCLMSYKLALLHQRFNDLRCSPSRLGIKASKRLRRPGKSIGGRKKPHDRPLRCRQV